MLAACDEVTVRRLLPDLAHVVVSWTALAARHPDVVAEHATLEVSSRTGPAVQRWWVQQGALVGALLRVDPARVVRLLVAHPERARALARIRLSRKTCARLTQAPRDDLAALLRAAGRDPQLTRQVRRRRHPGDLSQQTLGLHRASIPNPMP